MESEYNSRFVVHISGSDVRGFFLNQTSMKTNRRSRQRRSKPKGSKPIVLRTDPPIQEVSATTVPDIPDHLLEHIFLHLDSSVCLVRAASSCKRWCRVVADTGFLGRFRLLRAPLIPGHYHTVDPNHGSQPADGNPAFVPSPTMPSVHSRHNFSLDFVPKSDGSWEIADSRDGLLLLSKKRKNWRTVSLFNPDLVVCEPLTRRYQAIRYPDLGGCQYLDMFLLQGGAKSRSGGRRIGFSNFKVIAVLLRDHMWIHGRGIPMACEYSSGSDAGWRGVSCTWKGKIYIPNTISSFNFIGRANGSLYWAIRGAMVMFVLDEATKLVSQVLLPVSTLGLYDRCRFRVIGGEDGALRVVHLMHNDLKVFARLHGSDEWGLENLLELPEATRGLPGREDRYFQFREAMIMAAHETYILVTPQENTWVFSVDLKTMAVECPYELPWPPTLKASAEDH